VPDGCAADPVQAAIGTHFQRFHPQIPGHLLCVSACFGGKMTKWQWIDVEEAIVAGGGFEW